MCRASFEELVLDEGGGLRWNRLENLMEESSKSVDYDPAQLWLLAGTHQAASPDISLPVCLSEHCNGCDVTDAHTHAPLPKASFTLQICADA